MTWDWTEADLGRLAAFLGEHGLCSGPVRAREIGGGHSNLTYLVEDGAAPVVVRRPPPPPVPPGGHDVLREARLVGALAGTDVPVAEILATADAGEVFDFPFYVMSYVDGAVITTGAPPGLRPAAQGRAVAEALLDALVALHAVDWRRRGLEDFGRPAGFNRRHLRRISGLVADEEGGLPEGFGAIAAWLEQRVPQEAGETIVHSDLRIGNVIFDRAAPARILAVLDWELATIGDPLLDLGYFLASCPVPGEPLTATGAMGTAMLGPGYPARAELAARYAAATGRDLSALGWYTTMNLFKLAALYEYGRRRAEAGIGDRYYADPAHVRGFLDAAAAEAGTVGGVAGR